MNCTRCNSSHTVSDGKGKRGDKRYHCRECNRYFSENGNSDPGKEEFRVEENENQKTISSVARTIRTVDDALRYAEVDLNIWEVERFIVNKWEVGMRTQDINLKFRDGRTSGYKKVDPVPTLQDLWQVKVWLRRRVAKNVSDAMDLLLNRVKKYSPEYPKFNKVQPVKNPHLLEVSIFDLHLGKLAWGEETGTDYDVKISERLYLDAVKDLCSKASGFPIEKILFPIGQDFFHIDNSRNTTVNDTPQDVDTRYPKIFETGVMACVKAIDYMMAVAPIEVLWVPGNHDRTTSYHLVRELSAWYSKTDRVKFDVSPTVRKRYLYGVNLIGFTHGDEEKHSRLPSLMADEWPEDWAKSKHREWHLGHFHKKARFGDAAEDSIGSVTIRILPSLSGTDAWHYRKGYVKGMRAAEAYLWAKDGGYSGHFLSHASI